jgi:hypothetical protein
VRTVLGHRMKDSIREGRVLTRLSSAREEASADLQTNVRRYGQAPARVNSVASVTWACS